MLYQLQLTQPSPARSFVEVLPRDWKVLQALHLLGLQPTELLAPAIIRHLAHADLADCVHHVLALRDQNIALPQRSLQACIDSLPLQSPLMSKTYLKSDHFKRGGSQERRQRGRKVYSLHAPEVECIGKGKAHRPYEFGVKVSVATTVKHSAGGQFVTHVAALSGNPYDGHTLGTVIPQMQALIGNI